MTLTYRNNLFKMTWKQNLNKNILKSFSEEDLSSMVLACIKVLSIFVLLSFLLWIVLSKVIIYFAVYDIKTNRL